MHAFRPAAILTDSGSDQVQRQALRALCFTLGFNLFTMP